MANTADATVKDVANAFMNHKKTLLDSGEPTLRTFEKYHHFGEVLIEHCGKRWLVADLRPSDFARLRAKMAARWGSVRLGNAIQTIRSIFKHAIEAELIERMVRYGPGFKLPLRKVLRLEGAKKGPRLFTPAELHKSFAGAGPQLKAMVLLGINGGYGNADVGQLPIAAVDFKGGWVDFPRPKTGIARRCKLWPETLAALQAAIACRPEPKDPASATGERPGLRPKLPCLQARAEGPSFRPVGVPHEVWLLVQ